MTRVGWITDPRFLAHRAPGHPERPERLSRLEDVIAEANVADALTPLDFDAAGKAHLARVHSQRQIDLVRDTAEDGGGFLDHETYVRSNSYDTACLAAGASVSAARAVWQGKVDRAFAAVRPPGHHATDGLSMGFCLFNNLALAVQTVLDEGAKRVFIVDWDVHHGNGTQDIFYARDEVVFCSLHQAGIFPGTGAPDEIGTGRGRGATINLPLPAGAGTTPSSPAWTRSSSRPSAARSPTCCSCPRGTTRTPGIRSRGST